MFLFVIGGEGSELGSMFSDLISIFLVDPHHSEIVFFHLFSLPCFDALTFLILSL